MYKDDLTWLKGIGCYVWDTPEILHAKHAYDLRNDVSVPCLLVLAMESMFPSLRSLESRREDVDCGHCHRPAVSEAVIRMAEPDKDTTE